jgi:hypothetical protein
MFRQWIDWTHLNKQSKCSNLKLESKFSYLHKEFHKDPQEWSRANNSLNHYKLKSLKYQEVLQLSKQEELHSINNL